MIAIPPKPKGYADFFPWFNKYFRVVELKIPCKKCRVYKNMRHGGHWRCPVCQPPGVSMSDLATESWLLEREEIYAEHPQPEWRKWGD